MLLPACLPWLRFLFVNQLSGVCDLQFSDGSGPYLPLSSILCM